MYRIIGINSSGLIKLIKKEALNSNFQWWSSYANVTWPSSTIFSAINGSSFYTNTTYMPEGWSNKIEIINWKYGDNRNLSGGASSLYSIENGWSSTINAKIGLIYGYDYLYAYQSGVRLF